MKFYVLQKVPLLCSLILCCSQLPLKSQNIIQTDIDTVLHNTLKYLVASQYKTGNDTTIFKGEWHATMGLIVPFPLLGYKKDFDDANCFTVSAIHNNLAEIYLTDSIKFAFLKPTINTAFDAILKYQKDGTFNFWHEFIQYKKNERCLNYRKPTTYKLRTPFIRQAANVMNDFDDTASGFTAIYYQSKMGNHSVKTPALSPYLTAYIDKNRKNYNWYNHWNGIPRSTGAYMTWIGKEYEHEKLSISDVVRHTAFFWFPKSCAYPKYGTPYMPYGANDVDLVVNANILSYLSLNKEIKDENTHQAAIKYCKKMLKQKNPQKAVIYYPNDYHLQYAVARAYEKGVQDFHEPLLEITNNLIKKQCNKGAFVSRVRINQGDTIQSTAYAVYALLVKEDLSNQEVKLAVEKGIAFLLQHRKYDNYGNIYWQGGVFFSGGTLVKNLLFFKSDAYTTSIIANILLKYQHCLTKTTPTFKHKT